MKNSVLCYLEDTIKLFSDKVALTDSSQTITFGEWKSRALCIADAIVKKKPVKQIPILVYLPKSVMTLVSFAAVLYSGDYYTPTDVRFPFEKVNSILKCLMPELIISDYKNGKKLIDNGVSEDKIIYIEDVDFKRETIDMESGLEKTIDTDLAYVFFTSGSTGIPKGVSVTHRSIIDYIDWAVDEFSITSEDRIANQAPFYFDNSILDIYLCMSQGAHLFIVPERFFSFVAELLSYLRDNKISFIFWVPSSLISVANSGLLERVDCSCIQKVLFCGEVMPNKHLNYWRKNLPHALYANLYGPTEITDVCTYYVVDRKFEDDEPLPIGRSCKNTEIIILDAQDNLIINPDEMGELCIRGTCLSTGYYNNPEKTAEVFVQNPGNKHYPEKIYRTGDLAHYNEYGEIMFDGRKDFQIKHMGYRIELGEIETAILGIEQIENTCCVYDEGKREIIAFVNAMDQIQEVEIRKKLVKILPKYMIPSRYIFLEEFLYNDNGKIDRKQLKKIYCEDV